MERSEQQGLLGQEACASAQVHGSVLEFEPAVAAAGAVDGEARSSGGRWRPIAAALSAVAATVMVATAASRASGHEASAASSSLDAIHDGVGHPRGLPTTESPTPEPTTWMPSPMPSIPPTPTPEPSAPPAPTTPVAHHEWGDAASGDKQNMNDVSVASIEWTCGGDKMALACKVEATFDGLVDTDTRSWESSDTTWMTVQYEVRRCRRSRGGVQGRGRASLILMFENCSESRRSARPDDRETRRQRATVVETVQLR